ncbi:MAG: DUF3307 domain-containing protein [Sulfitobacter sp.]|nr:DUF3307 domain-containing protein [Sulfitobacter sp.]
MTAVLQTALILLVLLQVKHLFADYFLQSKRMLAGRGEYLHLGRAQHAGLHAVLSVFALLLVGAPLSFSLVLCAAEGVLHYHIDWAKGRHADKTNHGPADAAYWRAFGVDQLLHQLTYVGMIWAWAIYAV